MRSTHFSIVILHTYAVFLNRVFASLAIHFGMGRSTNNNGVILGLGLCGWILRQRYQLDRDKRR
jgi:hypothetical protein